MRLKTFGYASTAGCLLYGLAILAINGAIIWAVVHFVRKFW